MGKRSLKAMNAYQHILQLINSGKMEIGDQLPTENEISDTLGYSRPTVSKAISYLVEEDIIFKKKGIGNFINRKTETAGKQRTIGLLFPLIGKGEIFRPIAEEIINLSEKRDMKIIWGGQINGSRISSRQMEKMIDLYIQQNVDGILMAPLQLTSECSRINETIVNRIENEGLPLILVDTDYLDFPLRSKFDVVGIDNFRAGYITARHFIDQGAERVDFFKFPNSASSITQRIMGYQQALVDAGIVPSRDWIHDFEDLSGHSINKIINKGAENLICSNDDLAMKLIERLLNQGIHIPGDVRVSGFDNQDFAKYLKIPLTTIAQPCKRIAEVVIDTMVYRLENPMTPARCITLDFVLKVRESSRISSSR